jgi:hypothetical protein
MPGPERVVLVARGARQAEYLSGGSKYHHEMYATLVQPSVREQVLKLAAIRGLRALAFVEAFEDLVALAAAVLFRTRAIASADSDSPSAPSC